ncbi:MAG: glycosyltransferase 87 family protein, partial [Flavobacteriales bacterium]
MNSWLNHRHSDAGLPDPNGLSVKKEISLQKTAAFYGVLISFPLYLLIAYSTQRTQFLSLLLLLATLFAAWIIMLKDRHLPLRWLILAGLCYRALLLFSFPHLSDDIYRFVWDGALQNASLNPFAHTPAEIVSGDMPAGISAQLFGKLNSQEYFTVYPPVLQFIFRISTYLSSSWQVNSIIMKCFIFFAEAGSIYLMTRLLPCLALPPRRVLIYALNPLVITELCGNVHFEALMIFFLLVAIWLLQRKRAVFSAIAFGFAVGSKLLPLIFLPLLVKRLGWRGSMQYFTLAGGTALLLFLPYLSHELITALYSSIGLYFHKFEFNASIYYLLRWAGFRLAGYNIIAIAGPLLGLTAAVSILMIALFAKRRGTAHLFRSMSWALMAYLICSTIVHPWYITPLLAFSVFSGLRSPLLWSGLILLS